MYLLKVNVEILAKGSGERDNKIEQDNSPFIYLLIFTKLSCFIFCMYYSVPIWWKFYFGYFSYFSQIIV